ncbi:MAG TPA: gamma carbonic anhydrase family protein [Candidatus Limnocylindrales bacterium]|nr:gamma carbonic anhydrase family protein [Candidatus Limnocylindrales bacterium]
MIRSYLQTTPRIDPTAWIAPSADVVGDVEIGPGSSVWYGTVVRGDVFPIRIGARTNIQDHSVLHVTHERYATVLHDDITIGHRVVLHGCTIESGALVGIGAIVLDQAVIGAGSLVGAGALVTPGTKVPPGMVVMGSPAKVIREVTDKERAWMEEAARNYVGYARNHSASD